MELVVHLDDLATVKKSGANLLEFIQSIETCKLRKGTIFSGTISSGMPSALRQGEVQGVVGYIGSDMLLDMTLTSVSTPTRWTCSYRTGQKPIWIERK